MVTGFAAARRRIVVRVTTVLVVEDDPAIADRCRARCSARDTACCRSQTGAAAVAAFAEPAPRSPW